MAQPAAVTRLLADLAPLMQRHGFRPQSDTSVWTGKHNIFSWERRAWKIDVVRFGWRVPPVSMCFLDAEWRVPVTAGSPLPASALNAIYARRGIGAVELPRTWPLIGRVAEARWRAALLRDAERGLEWCNRCDTRSGALEDLRRQDRNGTPAGTAVYQAIERYVLEHGP